MPAAAASTREGFGVTVVAVTRAGGEVVVNQEAILRAGERSRLTKESRNVGFTPCVRPLRAEAGVEQRPTHPAAALPQNVG
jgi:hypothetical protein